MVFGKRRQITVLNIQIIMHVKYTHKYTHTHKKTITQKICPVACLLLTLLRVGCLLLLL